MKIVGKLALVVVMMAGAGCGKEPRSQTWFSDNIEEARAVSAACGGKIEPSALVSGEDECTNATAVVQRADADAYNAEQAAKSKAERKAGVLPKISVPVK